MNEKFRGFVVSKTMWFSLALVIVGVVQTQLHVFQRWLTPEWQGILTFVVGIAVGVLRWITTMPLEQKGKQ